MVSRFKLCGFIASVLGVLFLMREAFQVDQGALLLSSEIPSQAVNQAQQQALVALQKEQALLAARLAALDKLHVEEGKETVIQASEARNQAQRIQQSLEYLQKEQARLAARLASVEKPKVEDNIEEQGSKGEEKKQEMIPAGITPPKAEAFENVADSSEDEEKTDKDAGTGGEDPSAEAAVDSVANDAAEPTAEAQDAAGSDQLEEPLEDSGTVSPAPAKFKRRVPPVVRKVSKELEVVCQKQASYFCKHIKASFAQGCDHAVNGEIAKSVLSTLIKPEPGSSGPYSVGVKGELGIVLGGMNKGQGLGFLLSPLGQLGQERVRFVGFDISPSNVQTSMKVLDKLGFRHTLFNLGMSDRNGTLCTINPNEGRGRLDAAEGFNAGGDCATKVHLTTIEQTRANVGIEQTMFVMIDTEGHDLSVVFGLCLETTRERYPVIQFELGTAWCLEAKMAANVHRWRQSEASQYLQDLGYDLYSMNCDHGDGGQSFKKPKGGCLMGPLNAPLMDFINCEGHPQCMTGNMLAVYRPLASKNPLRSTLEKLTKGKSCKWN